MLCFLNSVYISVVTGFAKILDISDLGFFKPFKVYECASHAAQNGPGYVNLRQLLPILDLGF